MRKYWITQRVEENTTLRKNINDPEGFRRAERKLEADTGKHLWPANELCIRHAEGLRGDHPVLAKLWYFGKSFYNKRYTNIRFVFYWCLSERIFKS